MAIYSELKRYFGSDLHMKTVYIYVTCKYCDRVCILSILTMLQIGMQHPYFARVVDSVSPSKILK